MDHFDAVPLWFVLRLAELRGLYPDHSTGGFFRTGWGSLSCRSTAPFTWNPSRRGRLHREFDPFLEAASLQRQSWNLLTI